MQLFHYTDAAAVMSIVSKEELWLTDFRYLNDAEEMKGGIEYLRSGLSNYQPSLLASWDHLEKAKDIVSDLFEKHVSFGIESHPLFVCSFSSAGDRLSQWRSYGNYAVQFDGDALGEAISLSKCVYKRDEKIRHSSSAVGDCISIISNDLKNNNGMLTEQALESYAGLIREALTFKHDAFYEEKEIRCVQACDLRNLDVQYRARGDILIPYLSVPVSRKFIKAIHVGPMKHQELACKSMESFVRGIQDRNGFDIHFDDYIAVVPSKAPYRAL
ncbi:DUF2971 domain-containing protein [Pseudomonas sp. S2_B03]